MARDLALLLDRALAGNRVALHRSEMQGLLATAEREQLNDAIDRIEQAVLGGG